MEQIKTVFHEYGFDLTEEQLNKFKIYFTYLIEVNQVMNLTAIIDLEGVYIKHFLDSLKVAHCLDLKNKTLCDVGSGAGFPSIPLKILDDSIDVWIVDALNKRINFLRNLTEKLGIKVNLVHSRAEDFCKEKREKFDIVCARAVARLNVLAELCLPLVKKGGYFLAMKSDNYQAELKEAEKGIKILGGEIKNIFEYRLPYQKVLEYRNVISVHKSGTCSLKYPRDFVKIKKKPL